MTFRDAVKATLDGHKVGMMRRIFGGRHQPAHNACYYLTCFRKPCKAKIRHDMALTRGWDTNIGRFISPSPDYPTGAWTSDYFCPKHAKRLTLRYWLRRYQVRLGAWSYLLDPSYSGCKRCGTTWNNVEGYATDVTFHGGCSPLCYSCWAELLPQERLVYYRALWNSWVDGEKDHPSWEKTEVSHPWKEIEEAVLREDDKYAMAKFHAQCLTEIEKSLNQTSLRVSR